MNFVCYWHLLVRVKTMRMDEDSVRTPICRRNHGGSIHVKRIYEAYKCFPSSSRWDSAFRILGIILLPCLTSFGGITVFIAGCLTNISALIISGAAMFIFGILLCLLCGHICDRSSTKTRNGDEESDCAVVWNGTLSLSLSKTRFKTILRVGET